MSVERSELNVERSAPKGAVFLSYASQDAEAAKRIADALCAAGIEVWFDQSDLVGGDAWDAKIRGQISSCALFMPVISANTQARLEGYFRLEWKLSAQRTHTMADEKTFLLPIVIDDTKDVVAKVPAEFKAVQWTKLPGGETPPAFAARVKKLLSGEDVGRDHRIPPSSAAGSERGRGPSKWWWALPIFGVTMALLLVMKEGRKDPPPPASPAATVSSSETARLRARLTPDQWQKGDFEALSPTLDRIIQANPEDSDAWALRSIINSMQVSRNFDSGTRPLEAGRAAADRALRLAPNSPWAELALGLHLNAMISRGGDPAAGRPHVARALAALPPDPITRYAGLITEWQGYNIEGTERVAHAWLAVEPQASYPAWILAQANITRRRPADAEKWAEVAAGAGNITGARALYTLFESKYYLRADLAAAEAALARVPPEWRAVHRYIHGRWLIAMAGQHWDQALQELARVSESMIYDRTYHGPRALLAGLAHQRAGRPDAALAQFRESERLLRVELATDTDNEELHLALAVTLACAGRAADARGELALVEPLLQGRPPSIYWGAEVICMAQAYGTLGDFGSMAEWLRKLFIERSGYPFTPAAARFDPRFFGMIDAPEIQALLKEFASLDQPKENMPALAPAGSSTPADKSVAVLAFANLSDDKANEYFSDGISEELLNVLAKVPKLKVAARTSSFSFKGQNVPIPEIAQKLGVAYVVEGSVRKAGNKVRITAQLIKATDGFHVWSETYDRDLTDIFAVQDEIAKNILGIVKGSLLGEAELPHAVTTKPEAYALFLQAQGLLAARGEASMLAAERLFVAALAIDPDYVPALVGLARTRFLLPSYASIIGPKLRAIGEQAKQASQRALDLDPRNAGALAAHGSVLAMSEWRWAEGEAELLQARELAPNDPWVANFTGDYFMFTGNVAAAFVAKRKWQEIDPLSAVSHWDLGLVSLVAHDYDQAIHWGELAMKMSPNSFGPYFVIAVAAGRSGRFDLMRQMLARARKNVHEDEGGHLQLETYCAILEKRPDEAHRLMALTVPLAEKGDASPAYLGYCHLLLGESEQALAWLQRGYELRDRVLVWSTNINFADLAANPQTRPLLDLPGIKELYEIRQRNARAGPNNL